MVENIDNVGNSKFSALLEKHHLKPNTPSDAIIEVATRMISYYPMNLDWYLIAFGDVPETFEQFQSIMNFVKNGEAGGRENSLQEVLTKLHKAGKSIYPKEE